MDLETIGYAQIGEYHGKFVRPKSIDISEYSPSPKTFPADFMRKPKDSEIPDREYGLWYPN